MNRFITKFKRSKKIESSHKIKILITNISNKQILSSGHNEDFIYPRSSIKIFQAIPFIKTEAYKYYRLNSKKLALSCSSHRGENFHVKELNEWSKKVGISKKKLKCGIHKPLNLKAAENLLKNNKTASELHNNCAGKHLAMLTSCKINNYNLSNYLNFNHPHQLKIRKVFERFTNNKIKKTQFGVDGCSAPQYSFKIKDIANMLVNLNKSYRGKFDYYEEVKILINSIISNPKYIGGTDSLDSIIMSISNNNIFCKGGAEGVFLFLDLKKGISGVVKVVDGNERAIPSIIFKLFKKLKIMDNKELNRFQKIYNFQITNHAKIVVGSIETIL